MSMFEISTINVAAWLLALAFTGAGIGNAVGGAAIQAQFQRWGYPAWWNFVTAALEVLDAGLIVLPETRSFGLALGTVVVIAATATLIWCKEYKHLPPCLVFVALIGINHMWQEVVRDAGTLSSPVLPGALQVNGVPILAGQRLLNANSVRTTTAKARQ